MLRLSVEQTTCCRNERILFFPVDFQLDPGQMLQIHGTNGIGKSTLLRCLAGLTKPFSGKVTFGNLSIYDHADYKVQRFFLGHKLAVKPNLTVYENLNWSYNWSQQPLPEQLQEALLKFQLYNLRAKFAALLSAGQRQRLALARLCLTSAKLWLLDEPFSSLDKAGIILVQELMITHLNKGGMILLVSHQEFITPYSRSYFLKSADLPLSGW